MTITANTQRVSYAGNGVTTAFTYTGQFLDEDDLVVIKRVDSTGVETVQTITTHYTVSGGDGETGTVTFVTAPAVGETVTIYNDPELTQSLNLVEGDASPAESKERAWDRLTLICQRLKNRVDRSVTLSEGFADTFDVSLPDVLTGSRLLGINADGDALELYSQAAAGDITLPGSTGLAVYTGSNTFANRTLTAGNGITVTNGNGQSGNPTVEVSQDDQNVIFQRVFGGY